MANIGSLVVSLEANIARFESDLGKAEQVAKSAFDRIAKAGDIAANATKGIGMAMVGLSAGVGISTLVDKFEAVTKSLSGLKEMSERTGASVENLSGMASIAKIGGRDFDATEASINKLNKALHGSDDESKGAAKALSVLGLNIKDLRQMDPAQVFMEIAKAQEKFADSSGKGAVMMDAMGKSGAAQIPLMHDMAASGDLIAKTTTAQAEAADEYEKNLNRLTATKQALYKTIFAEMLPAMNSFVKVLIEANNETNGVRKAAKELASDGSIKSWAEAGAIAVAHVLDEFQLIKALAIEIGAPIERIGRNIYTVGALASIAVTGSLSEKKQAYAELKAENEKYFSDLNSRLESNRKPVELFSDRIKNMLAKDKSAPAPEKKDDSLKNYTSRAPSPLKIAGIDASPFDAYVKELDRMIVKQDESEYSAMRLKLQQLALKEGVDQSSARFADAAAKIGEYQQSLEANKLKEFAENLHKAGEEYQFQTSIIYKSVADQERLTIARKNFLEVENRIQEAERSHLPFSQAAQEKLRQASADATVSMIKDLDARRAADEDWANGAGKAYDTYMENARNVAKRTEELFTNAYKGIQSSMSDFLFNPFDKGVKGMLQSFGTMIQRMIADAVAADLTKKLLGAVGSPSSGGLLSGFMSMLGMGGGSGGATATATAGPSAAGGGGSWLGAAPSLNMPSFDVGTDYVPFDMVAKIHQGEKIIPAAQNTSGSGAGQPLNITVHVNGNSSAPDVRRAAGQGAREALAAFSGAGRYR